jgi:hypothetical protein
MVIYSIDNLIHATIVDNSQCTTTRGFEQTKRKSVLMIGFEQIKPIIYGNI